jgi:hypothetical protein
MTGNFATAPTVCARRHALFMSAAASLLLVFAARAMAESPCSLLDASEIAGVIGAAVDRHEGQGDISRKQPTTCSWTTATPDRMVTLAAERVSAQSLDNTQYVAALQQAGYRIEVSEKSSTLWCARIDSPPTAVRKLRPGRGGRCEAIARGFHITLDVYGPDVTAGATRNLLEELLPRLH